MQRPPLKDKLTMICEFGDILLFSYKPALNKYSILGCIGQLMLGERYGHGALYVDYNKIVEADSSAGVTYSNVDWVPSGTKITVMRKAEDLKMQDKSHILQSISDTIGKPYDYTAVIYLAIMNLLCRLRLVNKDWKSLPNPEDDPEKFFCFQLIETICRNIFYTKVSSGNITGEDIFKSWNYKQVYEVEV